MKHKGWIKNICVGIAVLGVALLGFYRFWMYPRYTVPILMYHYVDDAGWTLSVSPKNFDRQMKYLRDHKYNVISMDDFVAGKRAGKNFPHNTVVITFDDGWRDLYENAFPILKKYDLPATIYVITQWVGTSVFLNWNQIREMSQDKIDFGSHTQHHRYVPDLKHDELVAEIVGSKEDLERELGRPANHFCYPSGGFTEEAKKVIVDAGYFSAATTNRGMDRYNDDLYELMRVKATNDDLSKPISKPFAFWTKLSGYYNLFRKLKPGH